MNFSTKLKLTINFTAVKHVMCAHFPPKILFQSKMQINVESFTLKPLIKALKTQPFYIRHM